MATISKFLDPGVKQIRKSIKDIDDSYNNDWDILAELIQNSVDAIRELGNGHKGEITITINSQNNSISIKDNGCGIEPNKLPTLLAPFATDKEDSDLSVGEKGVGLTFVLFSCNDFYIKSGNKIGTSEGTVIDAYSWKNSTKDTELPLVHNELNENFLGTEIVLKKVADSPIFQLSFKQLEYVIRTRTAVGNTVSIWNPDIDILVTLTHINQDGGSSNHNVPFKYYLATDGLDKTGKIDIEEFYEYIKKDRTDHDKRMKLKDKIIYNLKSFNHNGRVIKAWACIVPKRKTWDDLTVHYDIATQDQLENNEWIDKLGYATFHSGIFTSVKGMPTGIAIEHPITGASGSWPQIFILFEDRHLKFDIGRKSIHGRQSQIYKHYSREIFSEFQRLSKYLSGEITFNSDWDKEEIFAEIDGLLDLNVPGINWIKTPREQEASVVGLFFECLGNKKIQGLNPMVCGYRNKYDLYARWGNKKVVIEFKSKLSNVLKDFSDENKLFNEINCLVCWDVTENDQQIFSDKGIELEEIVSSTLPGVAALIFPSATHRLTLSGYVSPVYVIDMKKIINS